MKVSELRALAAAMPVHMIPAVVKAGAFIMYKDSEDGTMTGGTIMAVSEDSGELTVQRREQDKCMGKSWMPSWQDTKTAHVHTGKKCPQGYSEHTDKVQGGVSSNDGRTDYDTQDDGRDLQTRNQFAISG